MVPQACSPFSHHTANPGLCTSLLPGREGSGAGPCAALQRVCSKLGSFLAEMLQGIMLNSRDLKTNSKQFKALAKLCPLSAGLWYLNQQLFFYRKITLTSRVPLFSFSICHLRLDCLMLFLCRFLQSGFSVSPEESRMTQKTS